MLAPTTISAAGRAEAKRWSRIIVASPASPIATGRHSVSARCWTIVQAFSKVLPLPPGTPSSFGNWVTITSIAMPEMKPTSTGRETKSAMKPSRMIPGASIAIPEPSASAASSAGT